MRPSPAPTGSLPASKARGRGPLRPTAAIAADVLLPDDPALALALAQELLVRPRMANHSFGLWGYSGEAKLGGELTIQAAGLGAQSLAAVVADLAAHGAARIVRLGRCRALERELAPGDALIVETALARDGISRALGAGRELAPDPALAIALAGGGAPRARVAEVASVDSLLAGIETAQENGGAVALDLETAALFALGVELGLATAALLVVSEPAGGGTALADEDLADQVVRLGAAAASACFASSPAQASASETASRL